MHSRQVDAQTDTEKHTEQQDRQQSGTEWCKHSIFSAGVCQAKRNGRKGGQKRVQYIVG